jgi:tryptophan synthase alpha chain
MISWKNLPKNKRNRKTGIKKKHMNRINTLFQGNKKNILSIYFTAGYPEPGNTLDIIKELDKTGVDMIEIGMPFSDPVADGPVIQKSSEKALSNGMSLNLLFDQISAVREITDIPVILMGYMNPVFRFGMEKFLSRCQSTGIDGTIIPDLPVDEYLKSYESLFVKHNVINIFLVSPQSTEERIKYLDSISKGFLYVVSSSSTTGGTGNLKQSSLDYLKKIDSLNLKSPILVGFGISDNSSYLQACSYSNGVIIGSAFIRSLDNNGSLSSKINNFVKSIRDEKNHKNN